MKNESRWYSRAIGVSNRRLVDVAGHPIFMNAPIPKCRQAAIEGWEVRQGRSDIGIVWATRGRHGWRVWHCADAGMNVCRHRFSERAYAVNWLAAMHSTQQIELERADKHKVCRDRKAADLADFVI